MTEDEYIDKKDKGLRGSRRCFLFTVKGAAQGHNKN